MRGDSSFSSPDSDSAHKMIDNVDIKLPNVGSDPTFVAQTSNLLIISRISEQPLVCSAAQIKV